MQFSQNIINRSKETTFSKGEDSSSFNYSLELRLHTLEIDLYIYFDTVKEKEILLSQARYETSYRGAYLGVIDGFFELIQGKPLEAIDRFPIKELDYFLRDNNSDSAFSGYSQELYEILGIGEKLKELIFGKKDGSFSYDLQNRGAFSSLSSSEQFEIIEEFLSFYFYKQGVKIEEIECLEIEDTRVFFKSHQKYQKEITDLLKQSISVELSTSFEAI